MEYRPRIKTTAVPSHLQKHRKYRKAPSLNKQFQNQRIKQYLIKSGYRKTLNTFIKQQILSENKRNKQMKKQQCLISELIMNSQEYQGNFEEIIAQISQSQGDLNQKIKIEFLLHVWYLSVESSASKQFKNKRLRNYIDKKGSILVQIGQVLPYFALPYIPSPKDHPFLNCIYTKQWKQSLSKLIQQHLHQTRPNNKMKNSHQSNLIENQNGDIQWLKVVKDLIKISLQLSSQIPLKSHKTQSLITRVQQYKKVLLQHEQQFQNSMLSVTSSSVKQSELSHLIMHPESIINKSNRNKIKDQIFSNQQLPGQLDIDIIEPYYGKEESQDSSPQLIKKSTERELIDQMCRYKQTPAQTIFNYQNIRYNIAHNQISHLQISMLFHILIKNILKSDSITTKKQIITKYIQLDILNFKNKKKSINNNVFGVEGLRLCYQVCLLADGRKYLCSNSEFIDRICEIIVNCQQSYLKHIKNSQQNNQELYYQEKLSLCLAIIQKISLSKDIYQILYEKHYEIYQIIIINFLPSYQYLPENVLVYVLAVLMNFLLYEEGKKLCSTMLTKFPVSQRLPSNQGAISLMQIMVIIWENFYTNCENISVLNQQLVESLIYSIIYVLLSLHQNRSIAKSIKLKQKLKEFLRTKEEEEEYYQNIIGMILKRIQSANSDRHQSNNLEDGVLYSQIIDDDSCASLQAAQEQDEDEELKMGEQDKIKNIWVGKVRVNVESIEKAWHKQFDSKYYLNRNQNFLEKIEENMPNSQEQISIFLENNKKITDKQRKDLVLDDNKKAKKNYGRENIIEVGKNRGWEHMNIHGNYSSIEGYSPDKYTQWKNLRNSHIVV